MDKLSRNFHHLRLLVTLLGQFCVRTLINEFTLSLPLSDLHTNIFPLPHLYTHYIQPSLPDLHTVFTTRPIYTLHTLCHLRPTHYTPPSLPDLHTIHRLHYIHTVHLAITPTIIHIATTRLTHYTPNLLM